MYRFLEAAGLEEIAKLLVTLGAEVGSVDKSGLTPFQVACLTRKLKISQIFFIKRSKATVSSRSRL
jgi:hypothetical protein